MLYMQTHQKLYLKLLKLTRRCGRAFAAPLQPPPPQMRSQTRSSSWLHIEETKDTDTQCWLSKTIALVCTSVCMDSI